MTAREKMIEAIARIIFEAMRFDRKATTPDWFVRGNSLSQVEAQSKAAAVLELVGPKPLVWQYVAVGYYTAHVGDGFYEIINGTPILCFYRSFGVFHRLKIGDVSFESVKAIAQAHADAAHWANTKLGDMIGGE